MNKITKHTLLLSLLAAFLGGAVTTPSRADETAPATDGKKADETAPATDGKKADETAPTTNGKKTDEVAPATTVKKTEETAPATNGKKTDEVAPTTNGKKTDEAAPTTSGKKSPAGLPAKIVSVDKKNNILVVEIKGHIYRFKMSAQVAFFKDGNVMTLDDLTAGQQISLVTGSAKDGDMEVVALTIEPNSDRSQAAGAGNGPPAGYVPPTLPPQANGRPPISPYR